MATSKQKSKHKKASARGWVEEQDKTFTRTSFSPPEGVEVWKPSQTGLFKLDVIPYVCGEGNPHADEGFLYFQRTYFVHRGLGLKGMDSHCCMAETFGRKCFICVWMQQNGNSADPKLLEKLRAQKRILMNVIDNTTKESAAKGVQILDQAYGSSKHPSFGAMIKNKMQTVEKYMDFWDLEKGYTLYCKVENDQLPGSNPYKKIVNIEMERREPLDESIVDKAACLDDLPISRTYDELRAVFEQEPEEDEEKPAKEEDEDQDDDEKPRGKKPPPDDDDEDEEDDEPAPKRKASKPVEEDEDDEDEDSELEEDEDDDEPAPKAKAKPGKKPAAKDDDEEDDEDSDDDEEDEEELEEDEDEDDDPPPKKKAGGKSTAKRR